MEFSYSVLPDFEYLLEERKNSYTAVRKIKWNNKDNYQFDIRRYYATENGERMGKGCSFMTDEGVDELLSVLIQTGYGRDNEIVDQIKEYRPYVYARFAEDILSRDKKELQKIIDKYPKVEQEDEEDYVDLEEVI